MPEGWQRSPLEAGVVADFPKHPAEFPTRLDRIHDPLFLGFQRSPLAANFVSPLAPPPWFVTDAGIFALRRRGDLETFLRSPTPEDTEEPTRVPRRREFPWDISLFAPRRRRELEEWLRSPPPASVEPQSGQTIRYEPLSGCGSNPWRMLWYRTDAQFTWTSWTKEIPLVVETPPIRGEWPTDIKRFALPDYRRDIYDFTSTPNASHWCDVGAVFLFTAANWGAVQFVFEAYFRASVLTGKARLFNKTDNAPVAGSDLLTTSPVPVRMRSGALTLVDGREYVTQIAAEMNVSATAMISSRLIAI